MTYNPFNGMPIVNVAFKALYADAIAPTYGSAEAAGGDLYAYIPWSQEGLIRIPPHSRRLVKNGIAIQLPVGFEAQVRPRSGLALKQGITVLNSPGTIDSDYRGELGVILHNTTDDAFIVRHGDRIGQLVVVPVWRAVFHQVAELGETVRGENGYGSTGVAA